MKFSSVKPPSITRQGPLGGRPLPFRPSERAWTWTTIAGDPNPHPHLPNSPTKENCGSGREKLRYRRLGRRPPTTSLPFYLGAVLVRTGGFQATRIFAPRSGPLQKPIPAILRCALSHADSNHGRRDPDFNPGPFSREKFSPLPVVRDSTTLRERPPTTPPTPLGPGSTIRMATTTIRFRTRRCMNEIHSALGGPPSIASLPRSARSLLGVDLGFRRKE